MGWDAGFRDAAGIRARGMQESAAGACRAVNNFLRHHQEIVGIVVVLFADHLDKAGPAMAETDDLIALMKCARGDAANRGIETGDVAAARKNTDDAFFGVDVCHDAEPFPGEW